MPSLSYTKSSDISECVSGLRSVPWSLCLLLCWHNVGSKLWLSPPPTPVDTEYFPFEIPVRVSPGFCDSRNLGAWEVGLERLLIRPGFLDCAEDDMGLGQTFEGLSVIQTRTDNLLDFMGMVQGQNQTSVRLLTSWFRNDRDGRWVALTTVPTGKCCVPYF